MEHQSSKAKNVMEHCCICERNIYGSSFAKHSRTDGHLLKTGERIKCDICKLNVEATEFENQLVSDIHFIKRTIGIKIEIGCKTWNKKNLR